MFGYIRPQKGQLRVWEYELFRAAYCGLCAALGPEPRIIRCLTDLLPGLLQRRLKPALQADGLKYEQ